MPPVQKGTLFDVFGEAEIMILAKNKIELGTVIEQELQEFDASAETIGKHGPAVGAMFVDIGSGFEQHGAELLVTCSERPVEGVISLSVARRVCQGPEGRIEAITTASQSAMLNKEGDLLLPRIGTVFARQAQHARSMIALLVSLCTGSEELLEHVDAARAQLDGSLDRRCEINNLVRVRLVLQQQIDPGRFEHDHGFSQHAAPGEGATRRT